MRDEPEAVLTFWFDELQPTQWWRVDSSLDRTIGARFGALHQRAAQCELQAWRESPRGRLAEVIVLDQFSRNIHRGEAAAFACDPLALALAQEAVRLRADQELPPPERGFLYMPYMHSESAAIHCEALRLFTDLADASQLEYERRHKAIVDRFGRYPHRNEILGRESTAAEQEFLSQPGSSF